MLYYCTSTRLFIQCSSAPGKAMKSLSAAGESSGGKAKPFSFSSTNYCVFLLFSVVSSQPRTSGAAIK